MEMKISRRVDKKSGKFPEISGEESILKSNENPTLKN